METELTLLGIKKKNISYKWVIVNSMPSVLKFVYFDLYLFNGFIII